MSMEESFRPIRRAGKSGRFHSNSSPLKAVAEVSSQPDDHVDTQQADLVLEPVQIQGLVEDVMEDVNTMAAEKDDSNFPVISVQEELKQNSSRVVQVRRVMVPPHRLSPLKKHWLSIVEPIVQHMKLLIRMNVKRKCVELKMTVKTPEVSFLQKGADFVRSFMLGFDVQDGIALLRLNDLFLESFEIKDVKNLHGDNLSRCIGRISGKEGKTKFAIENATRTRIVLADSHIHILGAFQNIRAARSSLSALILGSPAGKVYSRLRTVSKRLQERLT